MKIGIVGLGLIGGSYAQALRQKDTTIIGYDINPKSVQFALEHQIIDQGYSDLKENLSLCDVVFVCLYPELTVQYIESHQALFKENAVVSDVSGVKGYLIETLKPIYENSPQFDIVFAHPIAGKETSGIHASDGNIFQNMNFIITPHPFNKSKSIELISSLARQMGFNRITSMTPSEHDQAIGYTSQLTHVIALSLVNASDYNANTKFAIGDSYKDLTRIAHINENLWSELFIKNHEQLLKTIEHFEASINEVKQAIKNQDEDALKKLMIKSTLRRSDLDE